MITKPARLVLLNEPGDRICAVTGCAHRVTHRYEFELDRLSLSPRGTPYEPRRQKRFLCGAHARYYGAKYAVAIEDPRP